MAWTIICLPPSTSSLFPPAFIYLKAPVRKYIITKNEAMEKEAGTKLEIACPKDLISPNPKFLLISTWAIKLKMASLLLLGEIFLRRI